MKRLPDAMLNRPAMGIRVGCVDLWAFCEASGESCTDIKLSREVIEDICAEQGLSSCELDELEFEQLGGGVVLEAMSELCADDVGNACQILEIYEQRFGESFNEVELCKYGVIDSCRSALLNSATSGAVRESIAELLKPKCIDGDGQVCFDLGQFYQEKLLNGEGTEAADFYALACDLDLKFCSEGAEKLAALEGGQEEACRLYARSCEEESRSTVASTLAVSSMAGASKRIPRRPLSLRRGIVRKASETPVACKAISCFKREALILM